LLEDDYKTRTYDKSDKIPVGIWGGAELDLNDIFTEE